MTCPRLSLLIALLTALTGTAHGQLYKWVDENGKVHYGDSPPDDADLRRINGNVSSFAGVSVEPFVPGSPAASARQRRVVLYSTSWCGYCKQAAAHFRRQGIPFSERDIEKSASAAREFRRLEGRGVPVILVGDRRMNGFDATAFNRVWAAVD